jgi:hypothetical protein
MRPFKVASTGWAVDHVFMNPLKFAELKKSLGSKVQFVNLTANPRVSFRGVMVDGQMGPINVIPDHNCQLDVAWGVALKYWCFYSIGGHARPLNFDGVGEWLRITDEDGVEGRWGYYGNLGCKAPVSSIRIKL